MRIWRLGLKSFFSGPSDQSKTRPPSEAASDILYNDALLRQTFDGEGAECRILVADFPNFFVLG
jgi:hypothetical protein